MIAPKHTLLLIVILAIASIYFVASESFYAMSWDAPTQTLATNNLVVDGFGMSPGTLDQLQSTSVQPLRKPYLLF